MSGNVTIETTAPDTLTVRQQSDRAIVNWQSFSIDRSEHTQFIQPSGDALIVNRVVGGDVSEILGRLSANGRVMLLNPNGVLFGQDAQVDVNGLIASTLGLTDEQILNNDFSFAALPEGAGHIQNLGTITAMDQGLVALIAPSVRNDGVISARLGSVALVAGDAVTLDTYGDGLVQFQIDQAAAGTLFDLNGDPLTGQITNAGVLTADGGLVLMNAQSLQGVVDSSINMTGVAQARSIEQIDGEIVLHGGVEGTVLVSGTLDASGTATGESGGLITVFADRVAALDGASLNASGAAGGGTILFGGEYQGQGTDNATRTYVAEGASFNADAVDAGNGGRIIVWSDESTAFYGNLSARGGAETGNGGFAEISGKENLAYAGTVDLSAANGNGGQVLFDPKNIEISLLGAAVLSLNDLFTDFAGLSVTITPVDILALLSLGTDVVLQANNDLTLTDGLTVNNALGAGGNITLQAGRHVNLNANILSDDGNISITAGDTAADAGNRDAGIAALTMADGISLNAGSGDITLVMGDNNGGAINLENLTTTGNVLVRNEGNSGSADILRVSADALISAGSLAMVTTEADAVIGGSGTPVRVDVDNLEVQLLGTGGGLFLDSPVRGFNIGGAGLGGLVGLDLDGDVELTLGGALTQSERVRNGGLVTLDVGVAEDVTLSHASNDFASVGIDAAANVTLFDVNGIDLAQSTVSGALSATASGSITDSGAIVVSGATTVSAGIANNITLDNAANNFATVNVTSAANVDLVDTNAIDLGSVSVNGNLAVTAGGAITDSGALAIAGNTVIAAGAGNNVTLNSAANDFATVLINSANNVDLVDANGIDFGASTVSGALTVTADGAVTDSGAVTVAGLAAITAGAGNGVSFDTAGNDFATVQIGSANNVTLVDTNAIDLGASTVSGGLTVTADGAVTDSSALTVVGATSVSAGAGNNVTLDTAGNDFATVQIGSGNNVTLVDTNAIDLGASTVSGGLTVTADGAVTDSGVLTVVGATSVSAGAGNNVTLD
ncbi:MAG: filamentous hemagglutinin N-terminal domain-containing protein, partial [Alphaproteobacteria bacterium]|nr:filamentous hemagglutinin N-terminal domain-containing protein [Alphaproteobacteria bacterium]